jgi:DNA polymerase-4
MDAFYASVEQRDNPSLRGKACRRRRRSRPEAQVVAAASYEARTFGVRSAISIARGAALPSLVIVRPDFQKYRVDLAADLRDLPGGDAARGAALSLDESVSRRHRQPLERAASASTWRGGSRIAWEATNLTASAGVAPNKFLAKIASGWKTRWPHGRRPGRVEKFLQGLPVDALWGVGPVTAERLREHGIEKLTDVRAKSVAELESIVGSLAPWLIDLANGRDDRAVEPNRPSKSAGSEETYATDLVSTEEIRREIDSMARDIAGWLARKQKTARTVTIKVRYSDFTTITRSNSIADATADPDNIAARALKLLDKTEVGARPVRLLGVSVHNFSGEEEDTAESSDDASPSEILMRHRWIGLICGPCQLEVR